MVESPPPISARATPPPPISARATPPPFEPAAPEPPRAQPQVAARTEPPPPAPIALEPILDLAATAREPVVDLTATLRDLPGPSPAVARADSAPLVDPPSAHHGHPDFEPTTEPVTGQEDFDDPTEHGRASTELDDGDTGIQAADGDLSDGTVHEMDQSDSAEMLGIPRGGLRRAGPSAPPPAPEPEPAPVPELPPVLVVATPTAPPTIEEESPFAPGADPTLPGGGTDVEVPATEPSAAAPTDFAPAPSMPPPLPAALAAFPPPIPPAVVAAPPPVPPPPRGPAPPPPPGSAAAIAAAAAAAPADPGGSDLNEEDTEVSQRRPPASIPWQPSPGLADLPLSARYALGGVPTQPGFDRPGLPVSPDLDPFSSMKPGPPAPADGGMQARDAAAADRAVDDLISDDPAGQIVKAQWKQAHPSARKWAAKRDRDAARETGRTPKPLRIMLGFVIMGIAGYLAFVALPERRPLSEAEHAEFAAHAGVDEDAWRYAPQLYEVALGATGAIGFVGLAIALRGLTYRRKVKLKCKKCKTAMLTEPVGFGFRCAAGHPAGTAVAKVLLLVLFLGASAALGALTVLASLG